MSVIRGVKDRRFKFTQLLNSMLEDPLLSLKAKGFIGYCLSKPAEWNFRINHLCEVLKEGERAIYAVINECIKEGYAIRFQPRNEKGDFLPWETIISDSKYEIEEIKKELLPAVEIKNKFTDRCFADAPIADAHNGSHSNTYISNTDRSNEKIFSKENIQKKADKPPLSEHAFGLASFFLSLLKNNNPKIKEPNLHSWANEIDRMLRIDKRDSQEIRRLMTWATTDSFWHKNILSPSNLRKHFDRLVLASDNFMTKKGHQNAKLQASDYLPPKSQEKGITMAEFLKQRGETL